MKKTRRHIFKSLAGALMCAPFAKSALGRQLAPIPKTAQPTSALGPVIDKKAKVLLRGITWDNSRGYDPMAVTSQRFHDFNPHVDFVWDRITLGGFINYPITKLAKDYDLLVFDCPWLEVIASQKLFLPMDDYLPKKYMENQKNNTVGLSYHSYTYANKQWGLAIDAVAPIASYRPDVFKQHHLKLPKKWRDVLALSKVIPITFPTDPPNNVLNLCMLCYAHGHPPYKTNHQVVSRSVGVRVLEQLQQIASVMPKKHFGLNPIDIYTIMSNSNDIGYCPFAYGYNNYSRRGFSKHTIEFIDVVTLDNGSPCPTAIGGAGLGVSANTKHPKIAMEYAQYVVGENCQKTLYVDNGGQPGHLQAWLDPDANRRCLNYFENTLPALQRAWLRPFYSGYVTFQHKVGTMLGEYLQHGGNAKQLMDKINNAYHLSKK